MIVVESYDLYVNLESVGVKQKRNMFIKELKGRKEYTLSRIRHKLAKLHNCKHTEIMLKYTTINKKVRNGKSKENCNTL